MASQQYFERAFFCSRPGCTGVRCPDVLQFDALFLEENIVTRNGHASLEASKKYLISLHRTRQYPATRAWTLEVQTRHRRRVMLQGMPLEARREYALANTFRWAGGL
jgi:hypothetical protein